MVVDDLETKTRNTAIEEARKVAQEIFDKQKTQLVEEATKSLKTSAAAARLAPAKQPTIVEIAKAERQNEIQTLAKENSGSVAALRDRFKDTIKPLSAIGSPPPEKNVTISSVLSVREHVPTQPTNQPSETVAVDISPEEDSSHFHTPMTSTPANETNEQEKL
jgi:hypothetical protein